MFQAGRSRLFLQPSLVGWHALLGGLVAISLPSIIRSAAVGVVEGCEFTPYLPFVFLSAILLRWWQAAMVALGSVVVMGAVIFGQPVEHLFSSCFQTSACWFLVSSAVMIGAVMAIRQVIAALHGRGADETEGGVVFSLQDNQVWASWYGLDEPVRLGSQQKVEIMMADFLAQSEVAKRLSGQND
jgi:hypothetical protein